MTEPVIQLTPATVKHIKQCLEQDETKTGFRLGIKQSGCTGYAYVPEIIEKPKPEDLSFEQDGVTIYVDPKSVPIIKGTVLDYVDAGLGQKQMVFRNPNETASCGCGESFEVGGQDE